MPKSYEDGYETLLKDALDIYKQPVTLGHTRRVNTGPMSAFDSLFTSPELQDIQRQDDESYFAKLFAENNPNAGGNKPADSGAANDEMLGRLMIQQAAGPGGMYQTNNNRNYLMFQQQAKPSDYAAIGQKLKNAMPGTGNYAGGFQDRDTGQPIDIGQLLLKYRMMNPAQQTGGAL